MIEVPYDLRAITLKYKDRITELMLFIKDNVKSPSDVTHDASVNSCTPVRGTFWSGIEIVRYHNGGPTMYLHGGEFHTEAFTEFLRTGEIPKPINKCETW